MRPVSIYTIVLIFLFLGNFSMMYYAKETTSQNGFEEMSNIVMITGLGDPAFTTEARYTRHLSVSDTVAPFMDHPGALEHFPSGSIYAPPERVGSGAK